jgi:hypothetical protein
MGGNGLLGCQHDGRNVAVPGGCFDGSGVTLTVWRSAAAGGLRTTPPDPHGVFHITAAPRDAGPGFPFNARPRAGGLPEYLDYEARGLLNLVGLAVRCLDHGACRQDERVRWREDVNRANARLEALYAAGLPRDFLTNPGTLERPALFCCGAEVVLELAEGPVPMPFEAKSERSHPSEGQSARGRC